MVHRGGKAIAKAAEMQAIRGQRRQSVIVSCICHPWPLSVQNRLPEAQVDNKGDIEFGLHFTLLREFILSFRTVSCMKGQ